MSVEIANETTEVIDLETMSRLAAFVMSEMKVHPEAELAVLFVDEEAMTKLHVEWMDEPGPTDVLSFPMDELRPGDDDKPSDPGLLGDVVICPTIAAQQAIAAKHSTDDEIRWLLSHGILHLLGFDHAAPADERIMFALQRQLVDSFAETERS
jgi:probable rRNA maturation factor